jgi:arabinose-5-phosphate isomerase
MHTNDAIPKVEPDISFEQAILEITGKGLGITAVVDHRDTLLGIFTDGDLRRAFEQNIDQKHALIGEVMTSNCQPISSEKLAVDALNIMEKSSITALPVTKDQQLVGIVHMHDLLKAGIV